MANYEQYIRQQLSHTGQTVVGNNTLIESVEYRAPARLTVTSRSTLLRRHRRVAARANSRRGVLILVVLSLLVLFVVIAVMFVAVATRARAVAKSASQFDRSGDTPQELVENAMLELLRGSTNPRSPMQSNALLIDLYGHQSIRARVGTAPITREAGTFVKFGSTGGTFATTDDYYNGCVLTFTSGKPKGLSCRVVAYNGMTKEFTVLPLQVETGAPINTADYNNANFVVNGRQFSGTGAGFKTSDGSLKEVDATNKPLALLTNPVGLTQADRDKQILGGLNEDYDAPDYQNPFLGWYNLGALNNPSSSAQIKPSFHDPALFQYFETNGTISNDPALWSKVMFRPYTGGTANAGFKAMNSGFNPVNGPWDIDNDGDLVPDSIWMDIGLPVQTAKDGTIYKPLVAYLVLDMDGRLNLNAHDHPEAHDPEPSDPVAGTPTAGAFAGTPAAGQLPRGSGYGAAEIHLDAVISDTEVTNIFQGTAGYEGRYGEGVANARGGKTMLDDPFSKVKQFQFPDTANDYVYLSAPVAPVPVFSGPPDLKGRMALGLDYSGKPLYRKDAWTNEKLDDPYELDLSRYTSRGIKSAGANGPFDNAFSPAEFERLLRPYDADTSMLPDRLTKLLPGPTYINVRNQVTIDSFDVPSPTIAVPPHLRSTSPGTAPKHFSELLVTFRTVPAAKVNELISWDTARGLRMDINRALGNGKDDNSNGIADEPAEAASDTLDFAPVNGGTGNVDPVNGTFYNAMPMNKQLGRQLLARHLYVLLMFFSDNNFKFPVSETALTDPAEQRELTVRRIAQWAVNAVDYMDADNIMTGFEYDTNPWNGWDVDGVLGGSSTDDGHADRGLVWGCEEPVLLLTETKAMHDRRVGDSDEDTPDMKKRNVDMDSDGDIDDPPDADNDLDQMRIPEGSLFVELNSTATAVAARSSDIFTNGQLDLGKLAPVDAGNLRYPVWRLVISDMHKDATAQNNSTFERAKGFRATAGANAKHDQTSFDPAQKRGDPNTFSLLRTPTGATGVNVDRIVWFAPLAPTTHSDKDRIYYNRVAAGTAVLLPSGHYAVVGPREKTHLGSKLAMQPKGVPSDQELRFNSTAPNSATALRFEEANTADPLSPNIQKPKGIIVAGDHPTPTFRPDGNAIGLSISEPLFSDAAYYTAPTADGVPGVRDTYSPPLDEPLDTKAGTPLQVGGMLKTDTYLNVRTTFLQRLADPTTAYDPISNPYLTVDWMPIDLTVFNGQESADGKLPMWDQDNPEPQASPKLSSRQRGEKANPADLTTDMNIWRPCISTQTDPTAGPAGSADDVFKFKLKHSLGYLNKHFGEPMALADVPAALPPATRDAYVGSPKKPFPWIRVNNRPFANVLELMEVPSSHPGRLCLEFSMSPAAPTPYDAATAGTAFQPYSHLINFLHTSDTANTADQSANFYRIFEYLHVPSRFVGTETVLNANTFSEGQAGGALGFRPPFNSVSAYRDPGKVNINTINSEKVWEGVRGNHSSTDQKPTFADLVDSRRGAAGGAGAMLNQSGTNPTIMANPFRGTAVGDMVPLDSLKHKGVNVTLLRAGGANDAATPDTSNTPLFIFKPAAQQDFNNSERNPAFAYQGLQRMSNLVTTRSNVYAVWVTVGFFEVTPNGNATNYPDGYELGAELGSDTGEIRRHRGFYLIDRSIPVGFERGFNHNVDRAVILKRFIE